LISEVYLSASNLIVLELELVLELEAVIQVSAETLTHRKPNNVSFVREPNFLAIEFECLPLILTRWQNHQLDDRLVSKKGPTQ
jgi:hypothetical protein